MFEFFIVEKGVKFGKDGVFVVKGVVVVVVGVVFGGFFNIVNGFEEMWDEA